MRENQNKVWKKKPKTHLLLSSSHGVRYSAAGEQLHNKEANRREIKRQPIELLQMAVCEQENTHHNPAEAAKPGAGEVK